MGKYKKKIPYLDLMLLLPASLMAVMPYSMELRFNIDIFGYDFFVFLILGFISLFVRLTKKNHLEPVVIFLLIWAFVCTIIGVDNYYFSHYAVGIEFLLGYLFAANMKMTDNTIRMIEITTIVITALLFIQLLSFSLGLGFFSTGQVVHIQAGDLLRAGSTAGSETFTGIFLVLMTGLLCATSKKMLLSVAYIIVGLLMAIYTGTRSAMIAIFLMLSFFLFSFRKKRNYLVIGLLILTVGFIYIYPLLYDVFVFRNEMSSYTVDITSGREERWTKVFDLMKNNPYSYFVGFGGGTVPISTFNESLEILASPHNTYLGLLFQYGLLGLFLFLFFILKRLKNLLHRINLGTVAIICSLLVCWNTESVALNFLYSFYFWLLFFVSYKKTIYDDEKRNPIESINICPRR